MQRWRTGALVALVVAVALAVGVAVGGAADRVAVVRIDGVIREGEVPTFWSGGSGAARSVAQLESLLGRRDIRAVVLRLNSPGGSAAATQEIAREVGALRADGKKVVASLGDTAASGAYWIACAADRIVAEPATVTGSIGVITRVPQLTSLYRRMGVGEEVFKSGKYKDMGSPGRALMPEERAIFERMVGDVYGQFVEQVAGARQLPAARVRELADGRIYTGRQAAAVGLVDALGDMRDAAALAGRLAGMRGTPRVVEVGSGGFGARAGRVPEEKAGGWGLPDGLLLM